MLWWRQTFRSDLIACTWRLASNTTIGLLDRTVSWWSTCERAAMKLKLGIQPARQRRAWKLTNSAVTWRKMSKSLPITSLQSPDWSKITEQLHVDWCSTVRKYSDAPDRESLISWLDGSLPTAEIKLTPPARRWIASAMFRPTPPALICRSDWYVAPFSCKERKIWRL